jgi:tetratricopeptide (TPR) repeat protein
MPAKRKRAAPTKVQDKSPMTRGAPAPKASEAKRQAPPTRRRGGQLLAARLALMILAPTLAVLGLETALRLAGYGYPTRFFVKMDDRQHFTTNPKFGWQFYPRETATIPHPLRLAVQKPEGAIRIFVLGESAAVGTPDPAFGFARILDVMLRQQYPARRFEVINAAMRGVNSHILLPIARDCARHQPDLFLVYMGNNEVIGLHSPEPKGVNLTSQLWLLRTIQRAKAAKVGQLLRDLPRAVGRSGGARARKQDMDYFRAHRLAQDHPRRAAVVKNFRANLEDICAIIRRSGAKGIIATVAVNLRDFPPLASLHRADLTATDQAQWDATYAQGKAAEQAGQWEQAVAHYLTAARLDDHYAELHFRLARCFLATGQPAKAREHFVAARDWDALQFRTDSQLNSVIRELAAGREQESLYLADVERAFAASPLTEHQIPGQTLFNDYVHFSFEGDYLVARTFLPVVAQALALGPPASPLPSRTECAERLAFTAWDDVNVLAAMVQFMGKPPFLDQLDHAQRQALAARLLRERQARLQPADLDRAIAVYRQAIQRDPDDWQLRYNLAGLFNDLGKPAAAVGELEVVVRLLPHLQPMRLAFGNALLQAGRLDDAVAQFEEAVRLAPDHAPAREALAKARARREGPGGRVRGSAPGQP